MERPTTRQDSPPAVAELPEGSPGGVSAIVAEAEPGALARLGRFIPAASSLVRFAYRTAGVSAVGAFLIVAAVFDAVRDAPELTIGWGALLVVFLVLCIPAAAAALVGWTLSDLVRLPSQLRQAAVAAAGGAAGAVTAKGSRIAAIFRAVWAARGLALGSKDAWLKAVAAARFVRLASLPFVLALLGLFALNAAVVVGGLIALLVLVL